MFKKFYGTGEYELNQTADSVECLEVLQNEYHQVFSTLPPAKNVKIPQWKLNLNIGETCKCLMH